MLEADTSSPGAARARLLARIRREFDVVEEMIALGGRRLPFARIADPDAFLDAVCEQATLSERGIAPKRELRMPYWAAVWESGAALAEHLVERDADRPLAGRSALDLGCGMGLVGAAMAMLGARVVLADVDTASLLFARLNTLAWPARASVARCDWHADSLHQRFDLIAGGDVLYDTEQWWGLEAFARRHLTPEGVVLLGEPSRPTADGFAAWLESMGWAVAACERTNGGKRVRLYEARL